MNKYLSIVAQGGTAFGVTLVDSSEDEDHKYLGAIEYGTLSDGGQYQQDDEEIVNAMINYLDLPANLGDTAVVR